MHWESRNTCNWLYCNVLLIMGVWNSTTMSSRSTYIFLKYIIKFFKKKTTHIVIYRRLLYLRKSYSFHSIPCHISLSIPTQWTWVWANSRRWWRTGKPSLPQSMGSQRVRHDFLIAKQQRQGGGWESHAPSVPVDSHSHLHTRLAH